MAEQKLKLDKIPLIPLLSPGTLHVLPHTKTIGESVSPNGYFVRRRQAPPKYMQLYIGDSESLSGHETSDAPDEIREVYSNSEYGIHPYLIEVTLGGQGLLEYAGETYVIKAGEFCFIDCMVDHFFRTDPEADNWHRLWIYVAGPCIDQYFKAFLNSNGMKCRAQLSSERTIEESIRGIHELYANGNLDINTDLRAAAMIMQLLSECVAAASNIASGKQFPDVVRLIKEYVQLHYSERITLEMLAERFAMDKYYLQKLFTQHASVSPNEYLISTRMQKAKELLCGTFTPVSEVAEMVGIDNTSYFIKQFKRREGVTPAKYRQLMQSAGKR